MFFSFFFWQKKVIMNWSRSASNKINQKKKKYSKIKYLFVKKRKVLRSILQIKINKIKVQHKIIINKQCHWFADKVSTFHNFLNRILLWICRTRRTDNDNLLNCTDLQNIYCFCSLKSKIKTPLKDRFLVSRTHL